MGIASMIIGIVALVVGFIPFCGTWALVPAIVGLGLGIADMVVKSKRGEGKGMALAGVIMNPLAIIIIVVWWVLAAAAADEAASEFNTAFQQGFQQSLQQGMQQGNIPTVPIQQAPGMPGQPLQPMQPMQPMQPVAPPPNPTVQ